MKTLKYMKFMEQDGFSEDEFLRLMERKVRLGHCERIAEGEYRVTQKGNEAWITRMQRSCNKLLKITFKHEGSYTFGYFVDSTGMQPGAVSATLVILISIGRLRFSKVASWPMATVFYTHPYQKNFNVFAGQSETQSSPRYKKEVREVLRQSKSMKTLFKEGGFDPESPSRARLEQEKKVSHR